MKGIDKFVRTTLQLMSYDTVREEVENHESIQLTEGMPQQLQNICITFVQCWTNVVDADPTLHKCLVFAGVCLSQQC